jgi:antitoxin component YwqK of YwqJK toxin-antitoxin module
MSTSDTLHIAEIPFESGGVRFRYARRLSEDGTRWIRHGRFVAYHESGGIASEGEYLDGKEEGVWRDYHPNGKVAAEGRYVAGKEEGAWRYFDSAGKEEADPDRQRTTRGM